MVLEKLRKTRKASDEDYIVALDIGTEFVKALIAQLEGDELSIIGVGRARRPAVATRPPAPAGRGARAVERRR